GLVGWAEAGEIAGEQRRPGGRVLVGKEGEGRAAQAVAGAVQGRAGLALVGDGAPAAGAVQARGPGLGGGGGEGHGDLATATCEAYYATFVGLYARAVAAGVLVEVRDDGLYRP